MRRRFLLTIAVLFAPIANAEWQGYLEAQARYFPKSPQSPDQFSGTNTSIAVAPRYVFSNNRYSLEFEPFLRLDDQDAKRNHVDLRSLNISLGGDNWSALAGVNTVFWGVTEFTHIVDVINQVDQVEGIDDESVLGQPMISLETFGQWGSLQALILPGFRERRFPGKRGRLRGPIVNTPAASYTSSKEEKHIDYALRWTTTRGPVDLALSYFSGTARDPMFLADNGATPKLRPHYDQIKQLGLELQITAGEWLGKLEYVNTNGDRQADYQALSAGVEIPFVGILDTALEIALVIEYMWDSRGPATPNPFENDWALGARLTFNNTQDTSVLLGVIYSPEDHSRFFSLEASTRLNSRWRLSAEARFAQAVPATNVGSALNRDGFIELEVRRYF